MADAGIIKPNSEKYISVFSIIMVCTKEDSTQTIGLGAFDNTGKSTMELDDFAN